MATLGELKKKALMLMDEYSAGGEITTDSDINYKMNLFFDMAQKETNMFVPLRKTAQLSLNEGWNELPGNFRSLVAVYDSENHRRTGYNVVGRTIYSKEAQEVMIDYLADVDTITESTPDTYVLEVDDNVANCLPYYVASQHLITDLVIDYAALWNMYLQHRQEAANMNSSNSIGSVRNTLFRG